MLVTTKSAPAPIMPPIVNSSNKLSPIGNSSLYKPRAVKSCNMLAPTSCPPSNAPDLRADTNCFLTELGAALDTLENI